MLIFVFCSVGKSEGLERQRRTGDRDKAEPGGVTACHDHSLQTEQGSQKPRGNIKSGQLVLMENFNNTHTDW